MAKDCPWQTKDFDLTKSKETVAQQFAVVNSIDTMKVRVRVRVRVRVTVTVTVTVSSSPWSTPSIR
jgi:D-hexose-6-phosphate mutarotase